MPNKQTTHGGKRPGAGRPSMEQGRKNLVLDASEEEYREIIEVLNTRERTLALLRVIRHGV